MTKECGMLSKDKQKITFFIDAEIIEYDKKLQTTYFFQSMSSVIDEARKVEKGYEIANFI
ncbi:hypothetical protein [Campylobacter pinnipediorum]|nr:hypothetical protein [Campylobacter pinnipediorum]